MFLIQSEGLNRSDDKFGMLATAKFLCLLGERQDRAGTMVFWNAGVRLVCKGSQALEHLQRLQEQGVEILSCTTCLEYFELVDELKIGKPTTMVNSIQ